MANAYVSQEYPSVSRVREFLSKIYERLFNRSATVEKTPKKDVKFVWSSAQENAFQLIKEAFSDQAFFAHPDPNLPYVLETDASEVGLGAVLSQERNKSLVPIAFHSRQFSSAEQNCTVHDTELLHRFKIFCDHRNLLFYSEVQTLTRRQFRWSLLLAEYDFDPHYRPCSLNQVADALSRRPDFTKFLSATESVQPVQKFIQSVSLRS